jgi:hypothetical protein
MNNPSQASYLRVRCPPVGDHPIFRWNELSFGRSGVRLTRGRCIFLAQKIEADRRFSSFSFDVPRISTTRVCWCQSAQLYIAVRLERRIGGRCFSCTAFVQLCCWRIRGRQNPCTQAWSGPRIDTRTRMEARASGSRYRVDAQYLGSGGPEGSSGRENLGSRSISEQPAK